MTRGDKVDILNQSFIQQLEEAIQKNKIGYVVIDTLPQATDYDSNSQREVTNIYKKFLLQFTDISNW